MRKLVIFIILFITVNSIWAQKINSHKLKNLPENKINTSIRISERPLPDFSVDILNLYESFNFNTVGQLLTHFSLPANGKIISRFGLRSGRIHTGTDIKMEKGDTIYASFKGVISRARYYYGYGNMIVLEHEKNLETYYAHLSAFLVNNGDTILQGQPIGLAGRTGRATTNHLHFEIRENEKPYDPELVFDFENLLIRDAVAYAENLSDLQEDLKTTGYSVNEPMTKHYTITTGDSLWKISRRYKTTIQSICMLNNLTEQSTLQIGQIIKLF